MGNVFKGHKAYWNARTIVNRNAHRIIKLNVNCNATGGTQPVTNP